MFLVSLCHLWCFFPMCSVFNTLFKSTFKLIFFKTFKIPKIKKNQNLYGMKYEKKKVEGSIYFLNCLIIEFVSRSNN